MLADKTSLTFVYQVCAFLPAVGLLGGFLPSAPGKAVVAKTRVSERAPQHPFGKPAYLEEPLIGPASTGRASAECAARSEPPLLSHIRGAI